MNIYYFNFVYYSRELLNYIDKRKNNIARKCEFTTKGSKKVEQWSGWPVSWL